MDTSLQSPATTLEMLVDSNGLDGVLEMLAGICHEKSSHVEEAWQDRALARAWTRNAVKVERLVSALVPTS